MAPGHRRSCCFPPGDGERTRRDHQPAASDLRFITTALKIVVDLERIGDLAMNIAERALDLNESPPLRPIHDLTRLAQACQAQLRKSLDAFVDGD